MHLQDKNISIRNAKRAAAMKMAPSDAYLHSEDRRNSPHVLIYEPVLSLSFVSLFF